jgi:mono/diheme cytochrome c family protein
MTLNAVMRKVLPSEHQVNIMYTRLRVAPLWLLLTALGLAGCHAPQASNPIPSYDGARLYRENCASCHGQTGAGDGPMVPHLSANPSDLRTLSARNGGAFPYLSVVRQIDGRDLRAVHGSSDMPVWGWQFSHANNDMRNPAKQTQARINALVDHLVAIQR